MWARTSSIYFIPIICVLRCGAPTRPYPLRVSMPWRFMRGARRSNSSTTRNIRSNRTPISKPGCRSWTIRIASSSTSPATGRSCCFISPTTIGIKRPRFRKNPDTGAGHCPDSKQRGSRRPLGEARESRVRRPAGLIRRRRARVGQSLRTIDPPALRPRRQDRV